MSLFDCLSRMEEYTNKRPKTTKEIEETRKRYEQILRDYTPEQIKQQFGIQVYQDLFGDKSE